MSKYKPSIMECDDFVAPAIYITGTIVAIIASLLLTSCVQPKPDCNVRDLDPGIYIIVDKYEYQSQY